MAHTITFVNTSGIFTLCEGYSAGGNLAVCARTWYSCGDPNNYGAFACGDDSSPARRRRHLEQGRLPRNTETSGGKVAWTAWAKKSRSLGESQRCASTRVAHCGELLNALKIYQREAPMGQGWIYNQIILLLL